MDGGPPAAKRARPEGFASVLTECIREHNERIERETRHEAFDPEFRKRALDAVQICCSAGEPSAPSFTHQVFETDEWICGYRELNIAVRLSPLLKCSVEVQHGGTCANPDEEPGAQLKSSGAFPRESPGIEESAIKDAACGGELLCTDGDYEAVAHWYIETASPIDVKDERWQLLLCKERGESGAVVGFLTIFEFTAPLRPERPRSLRICQALVLPPYQKAGHARRMINSLMKLARTSADVFEVTVQDPCPAFCRLRDAVDLTLFLEAGFGGDTTAEDVRNRLKITLGQGTRCAEMKRLLEVSKIEDEQIRTQFRLRVKRRLFKDCVEELGALDSKIERKTRLAELYDDLVAHYKGILAHVAT